MTIDFLNAVGLIFNLAGSIILAASLLGLDKIARLRKYLGTTYFGSFIKKYNTDHFIFAPHPIPDAKRAARALLRLPINSLLFLSPLLTPIALAFILSLFIPINIIPLLILSFPLIGILICVLEALRKVLEWLKAPKNSREFTQFEISHLLLTIFLWPVSYGVVLFLAFTYAVEFLVVFLFDSLLRFASLAESLPVDRFIGILGVLLLGLGFTLQFIALLLAN